MSDQVTIGDYRLEISGDEVVVRDETGAIVETVELDDVQGELTLPDGQTVDLASILADAGLETFQTAAGPANDNTGSIDGGPVIFRPLHGADSEFDGLDSAGALGGTSLSSSALNVDEELNYDPKEQQEAPILVTWSSHDPWQVAENQSGVSFGKVVTGNPADFTFEVSDPRFKVVDGILRVIDGVNFDYESEQGIELEITATSRTGDVRTLSTHIDVTDVNEAQTDLSIDGTAVGENAVGAVVGNLTVADPDGDDSQDFQVSDDRFEVVDGQLKLKDGVSLDHEGEPVVNVTVTATDHGGNEIQRTFAIQVGDVNEAPMDIDLSGDILVENVAGAVIGTLTAIDPDAGDSHSFEVSDSRFEVVNGQLKLKDGLSIDFETEPSLDVVVTATDSAGNKLQETFTLSVSGANEAQTALMLDQTQISENAAGAVIGTLSVVDPDAGDSQSFEVSDNRFEVVNGQLKLKDGVSLDHEAEPTVNVQVTATDAGGNQIAETFTINVSDVNEAQTSLTLSKSSVAENAKGAIIGTVLVADPDAGDTQSYSVSDSRFQIVNGQLKLKSGVSINYEAEPEVDVTVTATDKSGHQISQTFTIDVTDVNEKQTAMTLTGTKVTENDKGAVIGSLSVSDPDAGDVQSYKVSDNRFEVVNGQLKLKDGVSLNYESAANVNVKVTATDTANHQITKTFTVNVQNVNEVQTAMTLTGTKVAENAAGAVIGTLKVTDPDKGDSQSYSVSDNRFEVVDGQLKLKADASFNYEAEQSVDVTVIATDTAGHQILQTFTIAVADANEAPTAIQLSNLAVNENAAGATIGKLTTSDPDAGDTFSYQVSDSRFEVVGGQLQLKSGVSLDHETEPSVNLKVTSTDSAGNSIQQSFTVNVANVNEAPTVTSTDGSLENHIVNTSTAYNPVANATVGAYLYSNDNAGIKAPPSNLLNGVDPSNMTLSAETPVTVTFQKEAAGNHNMIGTYQYDDSGNVIAGSVKFVWLDATAGNEGKLGANMSKDFLGYSQSSTIALGTMPAGTHVGFFTISNGANDSGNKILLTNAATGTNGQTAAMDAIASKLSIQVDANGNGHVFVGNSQMNGGVFFTHNKSLNTDFNGGSDIDHMASGVSSNLPGQLLIGVEDLSGGGDKDFNDVVFSVDLGTYNVNKITQSSLQPTVDFSDIDGDTLSQAVIHTSGFKAGDALNVPPSGDFNVTINQSGADFTITIVGKTGAETLDQYEDFANSIYFSTSSKTEGERHIDYTVTDSGGLTSTVSTADIGVANSYEISSSQLASTQNILGSGDDLLHINTSNIAQTNMGDGYDTVHLAKQDMSFGHTDAVKLENVEALDATGYGANNVSLSIDDVLNMTDGDNRLTIIGDKGDTVTLTSNGNNQWNVVESNGEFTTYAYSDPAMQAVVEISNQLNAQVS